MGDGPIYTEIYSLIQNNFGGNFELNFRWRSTEWVWTQYLRQRQYHVIIDAMLNFRVDPVLKSVHA